jgi:hypothetical protein
MPDTMSAAVRAMPPDATGANSTSCRCALSDPVARARYALLAKVKPIRPAMLTSMPTKSAPRAFIAGTSSA